MRTRSQWLAIAAVLLLALGVGLFVLYGAILRSDASPTGNANQDRVTIGHTVYSFDPGNDQLLADFATDIFVGRVAAITGTAGPPTSAPGQTVPQTQFTVEVLQPIKGTASGTVIVNQVGGVDVLANQLFLLEGDPLLTEGTTALFLTTFVPEFNWHQIVAPGYADIRIGSIQERARLVEQFALAADVEVPPPADATAIPKLTTELSPTQAPTVPSPTKAAVPMETPTPAPTETEAAIPTDVPTETATNAPTVTEELTTEAVPLTATPPAE